uniref:Uncharacterized protein n=1 Tax=Neogobius melanostomus TaxID=47308 RepID=A0A8C6TJ51_9GOBI
MLGYSAARGDPLSISCCWPCLNQSSWLLLTGSCWGISEFVTTFFKLALVKDVGYGFLSLGVVFYVYLQTAVLTTVQTQVNCEGSL